jgi:RNA polymerase sigma factor (sigma-70 family)
MSKSVLSINPFLDLLSNKEPEELDSEHQRIVRILSKAIKGELTQRQRDCVYLYYYQGKTVSEVAHELQIGMPTASKHLKKARNRLADVLRYSFSKLE